MAQVRCLGCGVTFEAYSPPCRPRKYCSQDCGQRSMSGRKQTQEHIKKRILSGDAHPLWEGPSVSERGGRARALRAYPSPSNCERCGKSGRLDRHHKDENTANNLRENIEFLCRKCHMTADGRINRMREVRYGHSMPR